MSKNKNKKAFLQHISSLMLLKLSRDLKLKDFLKVIQCWIVMFLKHWYSVAKM